MASKVLKTGIVILALVLVIIVALGDSFLRQDMFFESAETKGSKGKPVTILFMGTDARSTEEASRTDTMIVVTIDPATEKVAMVSIPRDTRIKNSAGKYTRINSINYAEGSEYACRVVGNLLDVDIDYYVITNFGGFGDIVDALGGVHIHVEKNMRHPDPVNPELAINISKGNQYLDGKQALAFVRYRGSPTGDMPTADIGRTENQQKFIKALAAEIMQSKTILKLPQLIPEIRENVHTNLPLQDMIYLANLAPKLDLNNIAAQTVPGYFYQDPITGVDYWEADKKIARSLLPSLLKGKNFQVVQETPASALPRKTNPVAAAVAQQQAENILPPQIVPEDEEDGIEDPDDTAVDDPHQLPGDPGEENEDGDENGNEGIEIPGQPDDIVDEEDNTDPDAEPNPQEDENSYPIDDEPEQLPNETSAPIIPGQEIRP